VIFVWIAIITAIFTETLNKGLNLHKCIELFLKGERDFSVAEGSRGHWQSIQSTLGEVKDVKMLELDCVHPEMFYRGKVDCVATFR
jgi:genome maintenance exonuclease 1